MLRSHLDAPWQGCRGKFVRFRFLDPWQVRYPCETLVGWEQLGDSPLRGSASCENLGFLITFGISMITRDQEKLVVVKLVLHRWETTENIWWSKMIISHYEWFCFSHQTLGSWNHQPVLTIVNHYPILLTMKNHQSSITSIDHHIPYYCCLFSIFNHH